MEEDEDEDPPSTASSYRYTNGGPDKKPLGRRQPQPQAPPQQPRRQIPSRQGPGDKVHSSPPRPPQGRMRSTF